ncbi:macrophage mannose receptor 1-like [Sitodiplosis mosellana]|uniref:macrophage mannose receptor 1-like n=1 Tax=Sitodiplosis mosellana TaxID=263140 RepID=UPI002444DAF7|nr:macrophage mannose receptor 1-like [Sitodiplosis mosellana]
MKQFLILAIIVLSIAQIVARPVEYSDGNDDVLAPEPEPTEIPIGKYLLFTTKANWIEATKQCRSKNMKLISILSEEDNDNVVKVIKAAGEGRIGFWTSGNRRKTNGVYFWGNEKKITYTNWEAGKPDNVRSNNGEEEQCIEIMGLNILKWNYRFCSNELYFICEEPHESIDETQPISLLFAQQILTVQMFGYYENNENEEVLTPEPEPEPLYDLVKKYHIFTTRVSWADAMRHCQSEGLQLVNILSKEDNDNVIQAIKDANQGEIGFWTSGSRTNNNGTYVWGNGQPLTFTDWENGVPDNLHAHTGYGQEECIELKGYHILKWNDHLCSYRLYYICEENTKQNLFSK